MRASKAESRLVAAACLLLPLLTTGCFQGQRVIRVSANGSGTVTDTVTLTDEARSMMEGFKKNLAADAGRKNDKAATEAKLRARAAAMGPGVTLLSFQPAVGKGPEKITYAFTDINTLRIDATPDFSGNDATTGSKQPLTFRLEKKGGNSLLKVTGAGPMPPDKASAPRTKQAAEQAAEMQAGAMAMMKTMMRGLKMTTLVQVDGTLVSTSSPYSQGSTVTLLDVDFDQLVADGASFKKLQDAGDVSQLDPAMLKEIKGIRMQTAPVTTIEFR